MVIYFGADHRGFDLKELLKSYIQSMGSEVVDLGAATKNPDDDYVDFARAVGERVSRQNDQARGILVCGSGAGMDIAANKFRGVRATTGLSANQVFDARNHDNINVLSIAADFTTEEEAKQMAKIFIETPLSPEPRHARRLEKIAELER